MLSLTSVMPVWAEKSTVVTDTFLYSRPTTNANVIADLHAGTQVNMLLRSGGWKKIEVSEKQTGWVRSYQVRSGVVTTTGVEEGKKTGGFLSGLASLSRRASSLFSSNRKTPSYQRTATIGVRGLSEEQIKNAKPDLARLASMEGYRSSRKQAKKFARKGKLRPQKLNHMPRSGKEQ